MLGAQMEGVVLVGTCGCGCPSVDFARGRVLGMGVRVNAGVRGSDDALFLFPIRGPDRGDLLGGIEWVGVEQVVVAGLPSPELLDIWTTPSHRP